MEVIPILGPLGSGKTTTLNGLIEHVPIGESYAVVVNDVGTENIDARRITDHPANRSEQIIALTAGCIGCSDVTQFREALQQVADAQIDILFIEPTGIAPGNEVVDVIKSEGHDVSVLTLVNARNVERDLKWQVLPSQLAVADLIGVTHRLDGASEIEVIEHVLDMMPDLDPRIALRLVHSEQIDASLLAELRGKGHEYKIGRSIVPHVCDHEHTHEHDHTEQTHGIVAQSLPLTDEANIADIRATLIDLTLNSHNPLLRAKGAVNGVRFDLVGDEWNEQVDSEVRPNMMNVIFGGDSVPLGITAFDQIIDESRAVFAGGDKKAIVKSINESLSLEDRAAIIKDRISQYPHPISQFHGELITDCEADEGYEIAFWGKDDLPEDVKREAMSAYISFRLNGLHELQDHPDTIKNVDKNQAHWIRRYGATLGYNAYYLGEYIDRIDEVHAVNPARLLAEGFMQIDKLTFDEGRAEEKPEFVLSVLKAALSNGDIARSEVLSVMEHGLRLSKENELFVNRWRLAAETL